MTHRSSSKKFLVAGHIAKDIHIKICDNNKLPKVFRRLSKNSTPVSKVDEVLGQEWTFKKVLATLRRHMIAPVSYSYGGRGPNVAYGAASLGAAVELISFVGEDFDKPYPGFYDGGYRTHLEKAGVTINELILEPDKLDAIDEENYNRGILVFKSKEIPTIYCIKDLNGIDFYFIDDIKGAHTLATGSPIPKQLVNSHDGVFVTSGECSFNSQLIDYAYQKNKEIIFDVGAYNTTSQYLKKVIPKCNVILGNEYEINLIKQAFNTNDVSELFHLSPDIATIILEDKIACTAEIHERERNNPIRIVTTEVKKRVSSIGCCDGVAAGYLALHAQGYDNVVAVKAGLIECESIWQVEGVQEGMLSKKQIFQRLKNTKIIAN
jgi:sugar/nucleoside kinase (ribokinase family)